ncbi:hypothetical protein L484_026566 [Morus notabilis]|uniref:Uncharacterized protein n=1 Tax=Morus notabilis TaxID=981085 RepID=W9QNZ2_9ROSA|nr:hypothetical protein L484_026566 [Morus notabilis]
MEDGNALAADCIVISSCCQCLILQIIVFVLLKIPYKLIRKTRDFAKKKLQRRKRRGKMVINMVGKYKNELVGIVGESLKIQATSGRVSADEKKSDCGCCMKEVEKVMEELSQKGEFSFGSFWCKEEESAEIFPASCVQKHESDDGFVRYQLIKMVGSISCS